MVHGDPDALPGFRGLPGKPEGAVAAVEPYGKQDPAGVPAGAARVMRRVVLHRLVLAVDHGGRDVRGHVAVRGEFQEMPRQPRDSNPTARRSAVVTVAPERHSHVMRHS